MDRIRHTTSATEDDRLRNHPAIVNKSGVFCGSVDAAAYNELGYGTTFIRLREDLLRQIAILFVNNRSIRRWAALRCHCTTRCNDLVGTPLGRSIRM